MGYTFLRDSIPLDHLRFRTLKFTDSPAGLGHYLESLAIETNNLNQNSSITDSVYMQSIKNEIYVPLLSFLRFDGNAETSMQQEGNLNFNAMSIATLIDN
jgi:hypothetical protein